MRNAGLVSLIAAAGCTHIPPAALDPHVAVRPRGATDQGVAMIYEASVCAFTLRDAEGRARTVAMPDHVFTWFTNGNTLLAVTPLAPGHYTLTSVTTTASSGPVEQDGHSYGYSDCTRARSTRAMAVALDVAAGEVTPLALPAGTLDLRDLDSLGFGTSDANVKAREAAWLPSIEAARVARRTALVAAKRQPRAGYDVYRDCGLFGTGTAVVHASGTPFSFYAHPNDVAERDRFRAEALGHVATPSQHASGFGGGCVEKLGFMVMLSNPAELEDAMREAGEWMIRDDLEGEVDFEVAAPPHVL